MDRPHRWRTNSPHPQPTPAPSRHLRYHPLTPAETLIGAQRLELGLFRRTPGRCWCAASVRPRKHCCECGLLLGVGHFRPLTSGFSLCVLAQMMFPLQSKPCSGGLTALLAADTRPPRLPRQYMPGCGMQCPSNCMATLPLLIAVGLRCLAAKTDPAGECRPT